MFAIEVLICPPLCGPVPDRGHGDRAEAVRRLLAALGLTAQPPPGRPVPAA